MRVIITTSAHPLCSRLAQMCQWYNQDDVDVWLGASDADALAAATVALSRLGRIGFLMVPLQSSMKPVTDDRYRRVSMSL